MVNLEGRLTYPPNFASSVKRVFPQVDITNVGIARPYPNYGYLMLRGLLKNEGLVVNKKHIYRLYTQTRLQLRTKKRKKLSCPCRVLTVPTTTNERWSKCVCGKLQWKVPRQLSKSA